MPTLKIHPERLTPETAEKLISLCPFSAIEYTGKALTINSACKMCKLCVNKGPAGAVTLEETPVREELDKSQWKGIAVFVEHDSGDIHNVTLELIGKARELAAVIGHPVYAVMMGSGIERAAQRLLAYGVDAVYLYDDPAFEHFMILPYANAFADFVEKVKPSSVLVGATNVGRSLAPRVAARFRTGLTADCTVLEMKENTDLVQIRPAFGGNIMAQIINPRCRPQFCTVRYKIFSAPQPTPGASGCIVRMELSDEKKYSPVELVELREKPTELDISEAETIVAVGRGVKDKAGLALAQELCDVLGAQMACTRPMAEAGLFNVKHQIGLSGRTVNAKLIITLGVSGSVQFAAGMRSSNCIVAVNKDKDASIFDIAHYGLVGDLYEVVPALIARIKEEGTL